MLRPSSPFFTTSSSSPVHTTLLQDGLGNSPGSNWSSLYHPRVLRLRKCTITVLVRLLLLSILVTPQRILREIETPSPLATHTILVKVTSLRSDTYGVAQPPVLLFLGSLVPAVPEESKNKHRNTTERRNNADDRILACAVGRRATV